MTIEEEEEEEEEEVNGRRRGGNGRVMFPSKLFRRSVLAVGAGFIVAKLLSNSSAGGGNNNSLNQLWKLIDNTTTGCGTAACSAISSNSKNSYQFFESMKMPTSSQTHLSLLKEHVPQLSTVDGTAVDINEIVVDGRVTVLHLLRRFK